MEAAVNTDDQPIPTDNQPIFQYMSSTQVELFNQRYRNGYSYTKIAQSMHLPDPLVVAQIERVMLRATRRLDDKNSVRSTV